MKRYRFIEDGLCCDVYYNKEYSNNKCALFLYGFPATIGSNDMTELLVEKGYTVLHPHYYGTYDSEGDFTPSAAYKTVEAINRIVKNGQVRNLKNNTVSRLPNVITVCVAYSFGAFVLKHTIKHLNAVKTVLLVSPVMSNNKRNALCWVNEYGAEHLGYVVRTRPFTYRIKDTTEWYSEYVNDDYEQSDCLENSVENILWLYGKRDPAIVEELLTEKYTMASGQTLSRSAKCDILCVENGNHGINSLLINESKELLSNLV